MSDDNKTKQRYDRIAPIYDKFEIIMEKAAFQGWREKLWGNIEENSKDDDKLLEAGVGTGKNIPYYPEGLHYTAIDFSPKMLSRAKEKASDSPRKIEFREMDIQKLEFSDDSFDFIVTSCVFCSVPDPVKGLQELKRVLKPEGKVYMLEHLRSQKFLLGPIMDLTNFIPKNIWGANINRKTLENIEAAGLNFESVEDLWLDIVKLIILS